MVGISLVSFLFKVLQVDRGPQFELETPEDEPEPRVGEPEWSEPWETGEAVSISHL